MTWRSHTPQVRTSLGMIPFQGFFLEDHLPPTNKKGVLCNRAMGIFQSMEYHGIPIELTLFFWAGEGPLHSAPLGGFLVCFESFESLVSPLDGETLNTWLKTCTRQVVYPIDLQRV